MNLPSILVVDDEIGAEGLFAGLPNLARWAERAKTRRQEFCQNLGLVPDDDTTFDVIHPVAKATFISCLQWNGELNAIPDSDLLIQEVLHKQVSAPPGYALVLLDLQYGYGAFNATSGEFSLRSTTYGIDVLLPALRKRFGMNLASPRTGWAAIPVIIVSTLPKEELESKIRAGGAREMLEKQTSPEELREALQIHLMDHGLLEDGRGIIAGQSLALLNCLAAARRAAQANLKVLLLGEMGTGKELIAAYIHDHSARKLAPYRVFHAPGRAEGLQEDEIFGHVRGAFTGAQDSRPGLLEMASGGTLFVDEIADVGQSVQRSLMRPVEQGIAKRMGASKDFDVDVKFIFATNKDIHSMAKSGMFLPDLLSRIEQFTIYLPPLRERKEDIPSLAGCLLDRADRRLENKVRHFLDEGALKRLGRREFRDSNIRELENLLRDAATSHRGDARITEADLGPDDSQAQTISSAEPCEEASDTLASERLSLVADLVSGRKKWNQLTVDEVMVAGRSLRGMASEMMVKLLELSLQSNVLAGRNFSMVRLMETFWGVEGITSQQAHRHLDRILKAAPNRAVATVASRSSILMAEPRISKAIQAASFSSEESEQ
jgi:two-component system response regulator PilR (NtrC family)